jgi:transposase
MTKSYRHLNFFQQECHLQVRTPRVKLLNGSVRLVEPDFAGRLYGFTLLFEAFILMLARQMPFAAVARIVGESPHRVLAVCQKYMEMACGLADYSQVKALALDETSRARGHSYVTLAGDTDARRVLFVTQGRDAKTIAQLAEYMNDHGCPVENIAQASIDMSPAFIAGVTQHLPNARITFDKFHVIGHASAAVEQMRRIEQRTNKSLKGMRWTLLKDTAKLKRRTHEGRCKDGSLPLGGHRGLGSDAPDQRVCGSHQRPVPGHQAPCSQFQSHRYDQDGHLLDRRKSRLPCHQLSR